MQRLATGNLSLLLVPSTKKLKTVPLKVLIVVNALLIPKGVLLQPALVVATVLQNLLRFLERFTLSYLQVRLSPVRRVPQVLVSVPVLLIRVPRAL